MTYLYALLSFELDPKLAFELDPKPLIKRVIAFRVSPLNVPVKSKLKHPPPGIPRAFDVFSCPGGREFDELSLPGVGHLITAHRGWEFDH